MSVLYSAAVMNRLALAGMDSHSIRSWWNTPHPELEGRRPLDVIYGNGERVLDQAERDAAEIVERQRG